MENFRLCENIIEANLLPAADQGLLNSDFSSSMATFSEQMIEHCKMVDKHMEKEHDIWMKTIDVNYDALLVKTNELTKKCCRVKDPRPDEGELGPFRIVQMF